MEAQQCSSRRCAETWMGCGGRVSKSFTVGCRGARLSDHINARTGRGPLALPDCVKGRAFPHPQTTHALSILTHVNPKMYSHLAKANCLAFSPVSSILTISCCHPTRICRRTAHVLSLVSSGESNSSGFFRIKIASSLTNIGPRSRIRTVANCGPPPCRQFSNRSLSYEFLVVVDSLL
jgi:hypothetical protein